MIKFDPIPIGQLLMPVAVSIGIWKMVQANNKRAEAGEEILNALRESVKGLEKANLALGKILERSN